MKLIANILVSICFTCFNFLGTLIILFLICLLMSYSNHLSYFKCYSHCLHYFIIFILFCFLFTLIYSIIFMGFFMYLFLYYFIIFHKSLHLWVDLSYLLQQQKLLVFIHKWIYSVITFIFPFLSFFYGSLRFFSIYLF